MGLLSVHDQPDVRLLRLYAIGYLEEKRAETRLSGLLQATRSNYLIVAVPTGLVRGVFDALHLPGLSLPSAIDGESLRAGIVVMTPAELERVGGAAKINERGRVYPYSLGELQEVAAKDWPGVAACWHLRVRSPELGELRRTYGLPTKVEGESDFSIVVACRKTGVLVASATSKSTNQSSSARLPDWLGPAR